MNRRTFVIGLGAVLAAAPFAVEGQQAGKVPRIGVLGALFDALRQGLREFGYVEGRNIAIEWRDAQGRQERYPEAAVELVRLKVDVIVAIGTPATLAAKNATSKIPIVMTLVADPVGAGLVASLARPGGNITGLTSISSELVGKQLELLKGAIPEVSRLAVLRNPGNQSHPLMLTQADAAGRAAGVQLQIMDARSPDELDASFSAMKGKRPGALLVLADAMFFEQRTRIADLAVKSRLPTMFQGKETVEAGGLMSYGVSVPDMVQRVASYVDQILKGANPADLPIEQPAKFELVINLKTAKALGLTIPPSLLLRADQVIE
jgi:putative tryptophan/tyrosine transport system substrate-binding protein